MIVIAIAKVIFLLGVATHGSPVYDPFFMSEEDYEEAYNFYSDEDSFNDRYAYAGEIMDGGLFDKATIVGEGSR